MKVFTITNGKIEEGAEVKEILINNNIKFKAVVVGEEGRQKKLAKLPVDEKACVVSNNGCYGRIMNAEIGTTLSGRPKLLPEKEKDEERCIVVLRARIGFCGSNYYTGNIDDIGFQEFPGKILARGKISHCHSKKKGKGDQIIAIVPKNVIFRVGYSSHHLKNKHLSPSAYYYIFTGKNIFAAKYKERNFS